MKFLVITLFVYVAAASAASLKPYTAFNSGAKAYAEVNIPARKVVAAPVVQASSYSKSSNAGNDVEATIISSQSEVNPDGYNYQYETSNGISASSSGSVKNVENVDALVVQGSYQYNSPDGPVEVSYVADENGFQPQGAHLPVAPPVPEAILRAIEYIQAHPPKEEVVKKF
ncbi:unnamed protein product [Chilo suppressalis]|uniref:Larval cuticle protein LCP-17-like n=1 Tax=Chilo suppressalis TaxID=168631 RepID=A0ABN8BCI7_CHISP|nr:hypothetical protein evm_009734 [Chilo suppressalis]CAH0407746.1 unnamed protein product [Chilo suppressalis]